MISWQAGVKGHAGKRCQAGVGPSPGVITGTLLVVVNAAGDGSSWKTKQLLSRFTFISLPTSIPRPQLSLVLISSMTKYMHACVPSCKYAHLSMHSPFLMVAVMEQWRCKRACNEELR